MKAEKGGGDIRRVILEKVKNGNFQRYFIIFIDLKGRDKEKDLASSGSFPKCPQ